MPILSVRSHMSVVLVQIDVKGYVGHCSKLNRKHWIEECGATGAGAERFQVISGVRGDLAAVGPAAVCNRCNVHRTEDGGRKMGTLYGVTPHHLLDQSTCGGSGEVSAARVLASRNTLRWEAEPKTERIAEHTGYRRRRRTLSVVYLVVIWDMGVR